MFINASDNRPLYFLQLLIVAVVYFLAAELGLSLAFIHANVSPVWPPTGVAIAALLLFGVRVWPGILISAFAANFLTPVPLATTLGIAVGNTLEALGTEVLPIRCMTKTQTDVADGCRDHRAQHQGDYEPRHIFRAI